ncbi:hypothetical protein PMAYCL1PPCAC_01147, partial [Pristionchus mayeri]
NIDFLQAHQANKKRLADEYYTINEDGLITRQPRRDIVLQLLSAQSFNIPQRKTEMCFLCCRSSSEVYATPMEPTRRLQFLNKIIVESSRDREHVEMLMKIESRAYFCYNHFPKERSVISQKKMTQRQRMNHRFRRFTEQNN